MDGARLGGEWQARVVDAMSALILLLLEVPLTVLSAQSGWRTAVASALISVGLAVPVAVIRQRPMVASVPMLGAGVASLFIDDPGNLRPASLALPIALCVWRTERGRGPALAFAALLLLGSVAWVIRAGRGAAPLLLPAMVFGFAWLLGELSATRRAYAEEVHNRLTRLHRERNQVEELVANRERSAIARELHDVVAHAVSVVVVHAEGALYAGDGRDRPTTIRALETIGATGRAAMADLRRVLTLLREEPTATQHGALGRGAPGFSTGSTLVSLSDLVGRVRTPGLEVSTEVVGDLADLPTSISAAAYRMVQEALTNVVKHATRPCTVTVRVARTASEVLVQVTDRPATQPGTGVTVTPPRSTPVRPTGLPHWDGASGEPGRGLTGLGERAAAFGGQLEAARTAAGGWRLRVVLPVDG